MKVLLVLMGAFAVSLGVLWIVHHELEFAKAARIGMCAMLLLTAFGHFAFTKGMMLMLPPAIPAKREIVVLTGVSEIFLGIGLLIESFQQLAGWLLILLFIVMLPANISAARRNVNFERATFDGQGMNYLWIRIPMQLLFIAWVYFSVIQG